MKKFVSILLALVMVFAFSTVAFAEEDTSPKTVSSLDEEENSATFDVGATVSEAATAGIVYSVEISWTVSGDLALNNSYTYTWNPASMQYTKSSSADLGITEGGATANVTITVINRSNVAVDSVVKYTANAELTGITSQFEITNSTSATFTHGRADAAYRDCLEDDETAGYTIKSIEDMDQVSGGDNPTSVTTEGTVTITDYDTAVTAGSITVGTFTVTIGEATGVSG